MPCRTRWPHPLAGYGRADLDFGQGFYVTTLRGQAERWANIVAMRIPQGKAILNIYELDTEQICQQYRCLTFEAYDLAWLNFIVRSRQGDKPWLGYDFIEGGVANDRVIDTVATWHWNAWHNTAPTSRYACSTNGS